VDQHLRVADRGDQPLTVTAGLAETLPLHSGRAAAAKQFAVEHVHSLDPPAHRVLRQHPPEAVDVRQLRHRGQ
jgi:hypothetical protein